jgi:GntR family transcriptional regulator, transcriptional repressor for pyruvate dehydrogenase complex
VVADYANPLNQSLALLLRMHDGDLGELFEIRRILEVESAGLAALRRTVSDVEAMRTAQRAMEEGLDSAERYVDGDVQFHLAVAAATHNRVATYMMQAIRDVLHRALLSIYQIAGSPERSLGQHRQILNAIKARRSDQARERMRQHLLRVELDVDEARRRTAGPAEVDTTGGL